MLEDLTVVCSFIEPKYDDLVSFGKVLFNPICIYPYANRVSTPCALIDVPNNRHSRPVLKGPSTPFERRVRSCWWLFEGNFSFGADLRSG